MNSCPIKNFIIDSSNVDDLSGKIEDQTYLGSSSYMTSELNKLGDIELGSQYKITPLKAHVINGDLSGGIYQFLPERRETEFDGHNGSSKIEIADLSNMTFVLKEMTHEIEIDGSGNKFVRFSFYLKNINQEETVKKSISLSYWCFSRKDDAESLRPEGKDKITSPSPEISLKDYLTMFTPISYDDNIKYTIDTNLTVETFDIMECEDISRNIGNYIKNRDNIVISYGVNNNYDYFFTKRSIISMLSNPNYNEGTNIVYGCKELDNIGDVYDVAYFNIKSIGLVVTDIYTDIADFHTFSNHQLFHLRQGESPLGQE